MPSLAWQPSATLDDLRLRAQYMARIRQFFNERGYLEVETPYLAGFGVTDLHLQNISATCRGEPRWLQTSPEYHMKRLLAAGSGPIFQIARVFRDDELGRWHNPEFSLLEWYKPSFDHHDLIAEMDTFLQQGFAMPALLKKTYQQAFLEACAIDPLQASLSDLRACLLAHHLDGVLPADETDPDQYLFLLMSFVVEPYLGSLPYPVAVYDFPASQAALAQVQGAVAERFEVYYQGVELANGFHELTDYTQQSARFESDRLKREAAGLPDSAPDPYLLAALAAGLPPCSGVALGLDRLFALAMGRASIAEVMAFDYGRA